jgi:glycosyltransferase involved in cell wall biosynthesis
MLTDENVLITVVSPVYGAENIVEELVSQVKINLSLITDSFEIILVNDSSPDDSWAKILIECEKDNRIKGINLSKNFGQHYAISAGLNYAQGLWIVVMDCDLQDRPEEIIKLYKKACEGWEIVQAKRTNRKDNFTKRLSSKLFHRVFTFLSGIDSDHSIANFGIYHSKVITEFNRMTEVARSFPSLISQLGFNKTTVDVLHSERYEGQTTYNFSKLVNLSLDVILSNSNKPLKLTVKLGFIISLLSFLLASYNLFAHFAGMIKVEGFTSTIFSIWFVGGLILLVLGVIGLYVGKIFDQVKGRQLYIVKEVRNIQKHV